MEPKSRRQALEDHQSTMSHGLGRVERRERESEVMEKVPERAFGHRPRQTQRQPDLLGVILRVA